MFSCIQSIPMVISAIITRYNIFTISICTVTHIVPPSQPETRKLQQVCYHQADIRMRLHRLLWLDDNKSVTNC